MSEKIAQEVAEAEFERFAEIWDIDSNVGVMSLEDKAAFDAHKSRVVKEVCRGVAVIEEDGRVLYNLKYPREGGALEALTFDVTRGNKTVMDGFKEREQTKRGAAYIGTLAGQPVKTMLGLDPRDQKFGEALAVLFLGS